MGTRDRALPAPENELRLPTPSISALSHGAPINSLPAHHSHTLARTIAPLPFGLPRRRRTSQTTMMQPMPVATLLVVALLAVAALAGVASADKGPGFVVTGRVYCDPCRAGFETNVSASVPGATVTVECRPYGGGEIRLKAEATTDERGWYKLEIDQDHQEEICEVVLAKSSDPDCSEIEQFRDRSRVPLTRNNGIKQQGVRFANPIAFFRKEPLRDCGFILQQYDLKDAPETP